MNTATMLVLAALYLVPLGVLAWLYNKDPAYAFAAVIILSVAMAVGNILLDDGSPETSEYGAGPPDPR